MHWSAGMPLWQTRLERLVRGSKAVERVSVREDVKVEEVGRVEMTVKRTVRVSVRAS